MFIIKNEVDPFIDNHSNKKQRNNRIWRTSRPESEDSGPYVSPPPYVSPNERKPERIYRLD